MKNGHTPKEFAYAIAIDALRMAYQNKYHELDDLTPGEQQQTRNHIVKLHTKLADTANLNVLPLKDT